MKQGDVVRLVRLPEGLPQGPPLETRTVFERAPGRCVTVAGVGNGLVELLAGEAMGEAAHMHSLYVEPDCVVLVEAG